MRQREESASAGQRRVVDAAEIPFPRTRGASWADIPVRVHPASLDDSALRKYWSAQARTGPRGIAAKSGPSAPPKKNLSADGHSSSLCPKQECRPTFSAALPPPWHAWPEAPGNAQIGLPSEFLSAGCRALPSIS